MNNEKPYIETKRIVIDRKYNPNYGDERICQCGHTYGRHFDSYNDMEPVGCKYYRCAGFVEDTEKDVLYVSDLLLVTNMKTDNPTEEYNNFKKTRKFGEKNDGEINDEYIFLNDAGFDKGLKNFKREGILFAEINHKSILLSDLKGKKLRINQKLYTI